MTPPCIEVHEATKRFGRHMGGTLREFTSAVLKGQAWQAPFVALDRVTFTVGAESLGIIGPNGSGKSTLLKLLAGTMYPTSGTVTVHGRVSPLIELGAGFHPDLSGTENVYLNGHILGMNHRDIKARYDRIVDFAGLHEFMDMPVKHFSSGMNVRLGFSIAVHSDPRILLVDEGMSVGDAVFQQKCEEKIAEFQNSGVTIVLVTHDLGLVEERCSRAIYLHHGVVQADGAPTEVIEQYLTTAGIDYDEA